MFKLKNKVAIVTGASRGIGKAIAEVIANAGAHVVCASRSENELKEFSNNLNDKGLSSSYFICDVSNLENFKKLADDTISKYESIDILVNNAGITKDSLIMRMSESDWDQVINVNLKGVFNGIKSVTRQMMKQKHGRIINISSIVGLIGNPGQANYAASKSGVIGLGKAVSKELASRNITVNTIAPGYIETDMVESIDEKSKENLLNQIPLGRIGFPDEIAATVLYLASDEAGYVSGQTIAVDGGMTTI
jgi:3-oxoacyl-[acyl-carrier protein] reductase|tara:strand:- start:18 stop:764 length:747 start_codon:yes stop_codon:yes gene_type:complete